MNCTLSIHARFESGGSVYPLCFMHSRGVDQVVVWQLEAGEAGIQGSLVGTHSIAGLHATASVTCVAGLSRGSADAIAGAAPA